MTLLSAARSRGLVRRVSCKLIGGLLPNALPEVGSVGEIARNAGPVEHILFPKSGVSPDHHKELVGIGPGEARCLFHRLYDLLLLLVGETAPLVHLSRDELIDDHPGRGAEQPSSSERTLPSSPWCC